MQNQQSSVAFAGNFVKILEKWAIPVSAGVATAIVTDRIPKPQKVVWMPSDAQIEDFIRSRHMGDGWMFLRLAVPQWSDDWRIKAVNYANRLPQEEVEQYDVAAGRRMQQEQDVSEDLIRDFTLFLYYMRRLHDGYDQH